MIDRMPARRLAAIANGWYATAAVATAIVTVATSHVLLDVDVAASLNDTALTEAQR